MSSDFDGILVAIGLIVVAIGLVSRPIRHTPVADPMVALAAGVFVGPNMLDWLNPADWGNETLFLEQAARVTLAIGLMGVALRLDPLWLRQHWRLLVILLGLGMPLMWLTTAALAYAVLGSTFTVALLIGAILTPTDPIVATSIVTGEVAEQSLPARLRSAIAAESGANDGLALPLVLLPLLILTHEGSVAGAWLADIAWQVLGATALGMGIGLISGRALLWAEQHDSIEKPSFLAYSVAVSLLTLGAVKLAGSDGILAVFVAGLALAAVVGGYERAEEENVQEAVDRFFTLPIFFLLGLAAPLEAWADLGWRAPALVAGILVLRRLPWFLVGGVIAGPTVQRAEAAFAGWFGPIGIAAVFYASLATRETGEPLLWPVASLVIVASVVVHGSTSTGFSRLLATIRRPDSDARVEQGAGSP